MLRSFQEYLQQPGDRFEEVDDVEAKVAQKNKLWKAVRDWNVSMENWNKSVFRLVSSLSVGFLLLLASETLFFFLFSSLRTFSFFRTYFCKNLFDVLLDIYFFSPFSSFRLFFLYYRDVVAEEVEVAVQQYYRTANQVTKALPDNLVAPKLLAEVENFRVCWMQRFCFSIFFCIISLSSFLWLDFFLVLTIKSSFDHVSSFLSTVPSSIFCLFTLSAYRLLFLCLLIFATRIFVQNLLTLRKRMLSSELTSNPKSLRSELSLKQTYQPVRCFF